MKQFRENSKNQVLNAQNNNTNLSNNARYPPIRKKFVLVWIIILFQVYNKVKLLGLF